MLAFCISPSSMFMFTHSTSFKQFWTRSKSRSHKFTSPVVKRLISRLCWTSATAISALTSESASGVLSFASQYRKKSDSKSIIICTWITKEKLLTVYRRFPFFVFTSSLSMCRWQRNVKNKTCCFCSLKGVTACERRALNVQQQKLAEYGMNECAWMQKRHIENEVNFVGKSNHDTAAGFVKMIEVSLIPLRNRCIHGFFSRFNFINLNMTAKLWFFHKKIV